MKKVSLGLMVFVGVAFVGSGLATLLGAKPVMEAFARLKIPSHLGIFLGMAKLCAGVALLLLLKFRGWWRLREWVFAGLTFHMAGATWWHLSGGDGLKETAAPIFLLILVVVTWLVGRAVQEQGGADVPG